LTNKGNEERENCEKKEDVRCVYIDKVKKIVH